MLAYHIREGAYGDVQLDGLNVLAVAQFDGNICKQSLITRCDTLRYDTVLQTSVPWLRAGNL